MSDILQWLEQYDDEELIQILGKEFQLLSKEKKKIRQTGAWPKKTI